MALLLLVPIESDSEPSVASSLISWPFWTVMLPSVSMLPFRAMPVAVTVPVTSMPVAVVDNLRFPPE